MMQSLTIRALKFAGVAFAIFCALSFTPLYLVPFIISLALEGGGAVMYLFLIAAGVPFAGYVYVLLFSEKGERLTDVILLTSIWVGVFGGSWAGSKLAGEL